MKYETLPIRYNMSKWAKLNGIELNNISIQEEMLNKGGGLIYTSPTTTQQDDDGDDEVLIRIPRGLILSKDRVMEYTKLDVKFKQVMENMGNLVEKPRLSIMIFLLYLLRFPDKANSTALGDYVKFLPKEISLPTFYSESEIELIEGTSLYDALQQKLSSLDGEFEDFQRCIGLLDWWDVDDEDEEKQVNFGDWKLVDAMYRSRALDLPEGIGDAMVPVLDMANHASDDLHTARFELDRDDGSVLLVSRGRDQLQSGNEITIMYGCGGACEMIFSYGFLEDQATSAREIFLALSIPDDDPLRLAKITFAKEAPGVRIYFDDEGQIQWESNFVWWACINEEDGLDFRLAQLIDGQKELKALWNGQEIQAERLQSILMQDDLRDIFVLRALVMIQERVEDQGTQLTDTEEQFELGQANQEVRKFVWQTVQKLRSLELELLIKAYQTFEIQRSQLMSRDIVRSYLERVSTHNQPEQSSTYQDEEFL